MSPGGILEHFLFTQNCLQLSLPRNFLAWPWRHNAKLTTRKHGDWPVWEAEILAFNRFHEDFSTWERYFKDAKGSLDSSKWGLVLENVIFFEIIFCFFRVYTHWLKVFKRSKRFINNGLQATVCSVSIHKETLYLERHGGNRIHKDSKMDKLDRQERLERTASMAYNKGLINNPGENNCFLNSAVQVRDIILFTG